MCLCALTQYLNQHDPERAELRATEFECHEYLQAQGQRKGEAAVDKNIINS